MPDPRRIAVGDIAPLLTPAAYLGPVATSGLIPALVNTGAQQLMSRTPHISRETISSLSLVFGNFYVTASPGLVETALGSNSATIEASVEYPAGVYTRVTFGGGNQGSIPSLGLLTSDATLVAIPNGAQFWVRLWWSNPDGIPYCAYPNFGNLLSFGTTTPNLVMGGGNPAAQAAAGYGPLAILGQTSRPTVALIGDSRVLGLGDTPDTTLHRGYLARAIGASLPYVNLGVGGDRAASFNTSSTLRRQLAAYCSHAIVEYGINDLFSGFSAAATHTALQTLYGLTGVAGKPIFQTTLEPIGTTGTYTSDSGQTVGSNSAAVTTFNDTLRGGIANIQGILDVAAFLESPTTAQKWATDRSGNALTTDGSHANRRGNLLVQSRLGLNAGIFLR